MKISSLSTDWVRTKATPTLPDGQTFNPTSPALPVEVAFTPRLPDDNNPATSERPDPVTTDWRTAGWQQINSEWYVACLVGPLGTGALAKGTYDLWVRITSSPEKPVIRAPSKVEVF